MINGKAIAKLRNYKGIAQKEVAYNMNVCQQYVSKLEKREKNVNKETLDRILLGLEISEKEWTEIKHLFIPPPPQNEE
jgi:transcriptional regulator with XRE-family HTH domain